GTERLAPGHDLVAPASVGAGPGRSRAEFSGCGMTYATNASRPLLEVDNLRVGFPDTPRCKPIVDGLSLTVNDGEIVAIVGESGSGKSLSAMSMIRLL